jgi:peptidoglycan lytic transglycosylase G
VTADELELAWDDDTDRGRHRGRRRRGRKGARDDNGGRGRRGRTAIALLLTVAILGALAGGVWYGFNKVSDFFAAPDYNSGGTGEVVVEVKKNQTAADIGLELQNKGVVKSQKAFVQAADANPKSKEVQPGFYKLRKEMRATDALSLLLDRETSRLVTKITVPEGKTVKDVLDLASKATGLPLADFEAIAKDPKALGVPDFWFNRQDKKQSAKSLEGFLFPSTYEFNPGTTAEVVLKAMVTKFLAVAEKVKFVDRVQAERKISPYEALIVASLSQAEAGIADDLGKISRVAYNRVYKAKMPLQFDVTANYWLQLQGKPTKHSGQLTPQELNDPGNPYNTVSQLGLPVGPINNPGEAALTGAMDPPVGEWLYFVAIDKTGKSAFAVTLAEHDKNIKTACANGVGLC